MSALVVTENTLAVAETIVGPGTAGGVGAVPGAVVRNEPVLTFPVAPLFPPAPGPDTVVRPSVVLLTMKPVPDVPMNWPLELNSWKPVVLLETMLPDATMGTVLASAPSLKFSRSRAVLLLDTLLLVSVRSWPPPV